MISHGAKTWVEVSKEAISKNVAALQKNVGGAVGLIAVVKSNAYGHGLELVAKTAVLAGAKWLGVDSVDEAIRAKEACNNAPILILGYTPHDRLKEVVNFSFRQTVYDVETVSAIGKIGKLARVHIKLETGTSRQGVDEKGLKDIIRAIKKYPSIVLEGLSTHYANIEDTKDHSYANEQLQTFEKLSLLAEKLLGSPIPVKHTACSAAAILFPETHFTLARVGIATYGIWPSQETRVSAQERKIPLVLTPALTWKTVVAQVKRVKKGTPISYGLTARVQRDSTIAVIPVGYYDGYDRGLSSLAEVLVCGKRAPILGRICMNMCMIDVTDIPKVKRESEVVLLGTQGKETISAEELAGKLHTISYEVVTRINPMIKRMLV